jgi:S-adenosyl-L-methionine hydrolase (adenosine-forming)
LSHSPVITLLSDLGTRDASVTVAKAILMHYVPGATFVDISHHVAQYDLQQAAYLLLSAYKHFPEGSVHLLLVDVFAGDAPCILLAEKEGHFFIAPDNGILPLAFGKEVENTRLCLEFSKPHLFSKWINSAGEVIKVLHQHPDNMPFKLCEVKEIPRLLQPQAVLYGIDCNVLYIDRYENVVLNIMKQQFEETIKNKPFKIKILRLPDITTISNNYNDVPDGVPLCRFNNAGFLEIALNHAPAASLLGLGHNNGGNLRYQTIRIFF